MTSIYKPLIKNFIISIVLIVGIAVSAFTTFEHSYASSSVQSHAISNIDVKLRANKAGLPKSAYEYKLQRDVDRLTPGTKTFSPYFIKKILTSPNKQKEV